MPKPLSFQELIQTLNQYWARQGCLVMQPYDLEVGAGTFSPHTFLRALGPEPWKAAYVEPSRRPTDGRYGENPHRTQHYYQYQVSLKPSPANVQELYLGAFARSGLTRFRMISGLSRMTGIANARGLGLDGRSGSTALRLRSSPIFSNAGRSTWMSCPARFTDWSGSRCFCKEGLLLTFSGTGG